MAVNSIRKAWSLRRVTLELDVNLDGHAWSWWDTLVGRWLLLLARSDLSLLWGLLLWSDFGTRGLRWGFFGVRGLGT